MVFQNFELFPHLSVTENLTLAQMKVLAKPEEAKTHGLKYLDRVGLMAHKTSSRSVVRWAAARGHCPCAEHGPDRHVV
jgi:ABC-type polar amino acid transport system ATPase subunit